MTWSVRVTKPDGTVPTRAGSQYPDYHACQSCQHGQHDFPTGCPTEQPCYITESIGGVRLLISIDVGADGHTTFGDVLTKCNGYEPIEFEEVQDVR